MQRPLSAFSKSTPVGDRQEFVWVYRSVAEGPFSLQPELNAAVVHPGLTRWMKENLAISPLCL
jgi:hypothetical protein